MKAMVLAAGVGSRLAPLTDTTPKCLVDVGGKPMIAHVFRRLKECGVTAVVVNVHHHAEKVIEYLRHHPDGLSITVSKEDTLLDTGGGIKNARRYLESEEYFIVHNADVASDLDLDAIIEPVRSSSALASLSVMKRESSRQLLFDEDLKLVGRLKKGVSETVVPCSTPSPRAFSGISCLSRKVFGHMNGWPSAFGLADLLLRCAGEGCEVRGVDGTGAFWLDMGTPERLEELRKRLLET